nr:protein NW97 [rat, liver, golgi-enriched membranes, Peptide Partial, 16 aa] [Rattus norvegicus]
SNLNLVYMVLVPWQVY